MLRQGRNYTKINNVMLKARDFLEHMFGNYIYCSYMWWSVLRVKEDGKYYTHLSGWLSYSNDRDQKIYIQLNEIVKLYGNKFCLNQRMHPFNTQTNEALMQAQDILTPNAKISTNVAHFITDMQLYLGSTIGAPASSGPTYFVRLESFVPFFLSHLDQVDRKNRIQKVYHARVDTKRSRAHKQDVYENNLMYENHTAEYDSGIGLDIVKEKMKKVEKV